MAPSELSEREPYAAAFAGLTDFCWSGLLEKELFGLQRVGKGTCVFSEHLKTRCQGDGCAGYWN